MKVEIKIFHIFHCLIRAYELGELIMTIVWVFFGTDVYLMRYCNHSNELIVVIDADGVVLERWSGWDMVKT